MGRQGEAGGWPGFKQPPGLSWMSELLRIELGVDSFSNDHPPGAHNAQEGAAAPTD